jgi:mRNA interferase MazF
MSRNAPGKGDYVHLDFDPQAGHEQAGERFGLVLSPREFCEVTGFVYVAPITGQVKGYPFEVAIPQGERCYGVVLVDQAKSLDCAARSVKVVGKASEDLVEEATAIFAAIFGF